MVLESEEENMRLVTTRCLSALIEVDSTSNHVLSVLESEVAAMQVRVEGLVAAFNYE
jgi:hypothetical protein